MSRKQRIKHMSSDELKTKLYSHFQKSGSLDHLKAQLRGQLVSELFKIAEPVNSDKFPNVCDIEKCVLPLQVCNWLVFDHLSRQNYQYTLSTFVTEAQLPYPEKFLTAGDILNLLGLKNTSDCENISKLYSINNELGFLHSLLLAIIKTMFHVSNKDLPIDIRHEGAEAVTSEKGLQNGYKESTQSFTLSKPEPASNTSFQDLPQLKQLSLNKSFFTNDDAKSAEASFLKEIQSFKEENEKEVQRMRHRLLDELDNLHSQKRKMQLELEQTKSEFKKEQNKLLKEKEMLKEKEVLLEKELTNQFEMNVRSLESEYAEKLHFKEKEIESLNRKLSEKNEKLGYSEVELASEKEHNSRMKEELRNLKYEYKTLEDKYSALLDQNTSLLKKYRNMSDYSQIKDELSDKTREFTRLQNETKDLHQKSEAERRKYVEAVRNLESNLNMKEQELMQAREEIDEVRNNFKREQAVWNKERRKYEHELREMKEYYDTLMQTLEEKNEELEDLRQTNQILNHKLANRVISAAKSESVGLYKRPQLLLSNQKSNTGMLFTKRNTFQPHSEKEYNSKFKFFSDKKSTFGTLKQEENKIQEKYSIINSTMPEYNKSISYPRSCNFLSLPKKDADSFGVFSKITLSSPPFYYDKSRLSTATKSPYSLSDVRQMVTHTLSPHKTSKYTDFKINTSSFGSTSQMQSISDTRVKEVWTVPESSDYNFPKQYGLTRASDNTSILSTMRHRSSLSKDNITSENSLHLSSADKNNGENHKITLNSKELNNEVAIDKDSIDKLEEDSVRAESLRKGCLEANTHDVSSDVSKDMASTIPENSKAISDQGNISNKNHAIITQVQSAPCNSSNDIHNVTSEPIGNKPESTFSDFINLDDAWKKRSSVTSLSYRKDIINETDLRDRPDSSLYSSSVVTNNKNIFSSKPHTFDGSLGKLTKIDSENAFNKSPENKNNVSVKGNIKGFSHLQQNTSKQTEDSAIEREASLYDKSMRNLNNDKISSEDVFNKSTENVDYDSTKDGTISASHSLQDRNKQTGDSLNTVKELSLCDKSHTNTNTDKTKCDTGDTSNKLQTLDKKTNNFIVNRKLPFREEKQMSHSYGEINKEEKTNKSEEEDNGKFSAKTGNTDSLSEQSELHLSCGSEAEQQKEDSDAW